MYRHISSIKYWHRFKDHHGQQNNFHVCYWLSVWSNQKRSQLKFAIFKLVFWAWFIWPIRFKGQRSYFFSQTLPAATSKKSLTLNQAQNANLKMANLSWDILHYIYKRFQILCAKHVLWVKSRFSGFSFSKPIGSMKGMSYWYSIEYWRNIGGFPGILGETPEYWRNIYQNYNCE